MTISAAMTRAEQAIMQLVDTETGEVVLHARPRLAERIVIEVLIAFFDDEEVRQRLIGEAE